jgi:hypothetical protein
MTPELENVLAAVAAVVALLATASASFTKASVARETREAVRRAHGSRPDQAISMLDLSQLGDYMYGALGSIPIAEYASNPRARADVARGLERIERFLSDDETPPPAQQDDNAASHALAAAQRALGSGDTWTGLAQLRRSIEIELHQLATRREISVPKRAGAGLLLRILGDRQLLARDIALTLRKSIRVANKAIHGEDVSPAAAEEAFVGADYALRSVRAS